MDDCIQHSRETRQLLNTHELLTQERLKAVDDKLGSIEGIIKWAGGLIITLLLSVLGWSVVQQISANEAQKTELRQQLLLLQGQQERASVESATRAAEAADAARRDRQLLNLADKHRPKNGR